MGIFDDNSQQLNRVIEESVPGKQVTIAHVIAAPVTDIYERLGIDNLGAIGILTLSPYETAIIAADIATKAAQESVFWTVSPARSSSPEMWTAWKPLCRRSHGRCTI